MRLNSKQGYSFDFFLRVSPTHPIFPERVDQASEWMTEYKYTTYERLSESQCHRCIMRAYSIHAGTDELVMFGQSDNQIGEKSSGQSGHIRMTNWLEWITKKKRVTERTKDEKAVRVEYVELPVD